MFSSFISSVKVAIDNVIKVEPISAPNAETNGFVPTKQEYIIISDTPSITDSKKAVIYCRVSTPQQSNNAQEHACNLYCQQKGYEVVDVIKEVGSGYTGKKQQKLKQFINDNQDINLIVYKIDRFSRNSSEGDSMVKQMIANKINLECITDPVNLTSSLGKLKFREAISKAQFESEQISERVKSYHKYRVANNINIKRGVYGYKLSEDKKSLEVIHEEQAVMNFIIANLKTKKTSSEATNLLYKLMKKIGSPKDHFVPVEFFDDSKNKMYPDDYAMLMTPRMISELLNDYNIRKRGTPWNAAKVNAVFKKSMDIGNLSIN